jgi:hypothetical protein
MKNKIISLLIKLSKINWCYKLIIFILAFFVIMLLFKTVSIIALPYILNLFVVLAEESVNDVDSNNNNTNVDKINGKENYWYWCKWLGVSVLVGVVIIIMFQGPGGPFDIANSIPQIATYQNIDINVSNDNDNEFICSFEKESYYVDMDKANSDVKS